MYTKKFKEWIDTYERISNLSLEELPEYLTYKYPGIRLRARERMLELEYRDRHVHVKPLHL